MLYPRPYDLTNHSKYAPYMKTRILAALVVLSLSLFSQRGVAAEPTRRRRPNSRTLVAKVKTKLQAGQED